MRFGPFLTQEAFLGHLQRKKAEDTDIARLDWEKADASTVGGVVTALNALQADVAGMEDTIPQFVTSDILTVGQVMQNFPPSASRRGKYVRVSDLYGFIDGVMRCGLDAATNYYFWQPTTPEYGRTITVTGNVSFGPLTSPTSINLAGNLLAGVTRQITLTTTNGRPGEIKEIKNGMTGLGALQILGVGSAITFALNGYMKFMLDYSSGSAAWVRLV